MQTETEDVGVQQQVVGGEMPYGQEFLDTLKSLGGLSFFTLTMRYAKIQQLKAADRTETLRIIRARRFSILSYNDPELEPHIERDSASDLARWLYMREQWLHRKLCELISLLACVLYVALYLSSLGR